MKLTAQSILGSLAKKRGARATVENDLIDLAAARMAEVMEKIEDKKFIIVGFNNIADHREAQELAMLRVLGRVSEIIQGEKA